MSSDSAPDHPTSESLAAFLDGALTRAERAELAAHLDTCAECRRDVVASSRLLERNSSAAGAAVGTGHRSRWIAAVTGMAAVAAAVALVIAPRPSPAPANEALQERGAPATALRAEHPGDGAVLSPSAATFAWTDAGAGALYRFTLSDDTGQVLWSTQLRQLSVELPPETARTMQAGRVYFWRVDALLPDLHSITTGDRRLVAGAR